MGLRSVRVAILRDARKKRAPQDEDLFLGVGFFDAGFFLATTLRCAGFVTAAFAAFRAFGRLRSAARCAAASAALAQPVSSSGSSYSRSGNCQYELTVTVLVLVWY
jgi:hypothetical protein